MECLFDTLKYGTCMSVFGPLTFGKFTEFHKFNIWCIQKDIHLLSRNQKEILFPWIQQWQLSGAFWEAVFSSFATFSLNFQKIDFYFRLTLEKKMPSCRPEEQCFPSNRRYSFLTSAIYRKRLYQERFLRNIIIFFAGKCTSLFFFTNTIASFSVRLVKMICAINFLLEHFF